MLENLIVARCNNDIETKSTPVKLLKNLNCWNLLEMFSLDSDLKPMIVRMRRF